MTDDVLTLSHKLSLNPHTTCIVQLVLLTKIIKLRQDQIFKHRDFAHFEIKKITNNRALVISYNRIEKFLDYLTRDTIYQSKM